MDSQLFPSLILATATQRPEDDEHDSVAGSRRSWAILRLRRGVDHRAEGRHESARHAGGEQRHERQLVVRRSQNGGHGVLRRAEGKLEDRATRKTRQQLRLNVTFKVAVNSKEIGEQTETISLRTINDCPFGVSEAEETIDDENAEEEGEEDNGREASGKASHQKAVAPHVIGSEEARRNASDDEKEGGGEYTDMGWMFAAYVNENSPTVERILKEALATKIVDSFAGYQKNPDEVVKEVFAIWTALQNRGIKYSNITTTAADSPSVYSQHVRFVDESVANEQANCVDGSVLFGRSCGSSGCGPFSRRCPATCSWVFISLRMGTSVSRLRRRMIGGREDQETTRSKLMEGLQRVRAGSWRRKLRKASPGRRSRPRLPWARRTPREEQSEIRGRR